MASRRKPALSDSRTAFPIPPNPAQTQPWPGFQHRMEPRPDCGEISYQGNGRLKGRKALVTGGDSGIGRAVAIAYAREGADVAFTYLPIEREDAQETRERIEAEGRKAVLIPGDLADEGFSHYMVETAQKELGALDCLALVAGRQIAVKSIEDIETEQLDEVFSVNVFSLFWTIRAALPLLPEGSAIILTTSRQAFNPEAELLDYSTTKGAIRTLTPALAKLLAPRGIRVNAVAPGPTWTPLQVSGGHFPEEIPEFGENTPLKRAAQPLEMAPLYVFLASQEASYVTGMIYGATGIAPR